VNCRNTKRKKEYYLPMIAFKYFADHDVRKVEIDRPKPRPDELLVKILATGVCGTDLHIYTHGDWIGKAPIPEVTMGHEFVGEVQRGHSDRQSGVRRAAHSVREVLLVPARRG